MQLFFVWKKNEKNKEKLLENEARHIIFRQEKLLIFVVISLVRCQFSWFCNNIGIQSQMFSNYKTDKRFKTNVCDLSRSSLWLKFFFGIWQIH